MRQCPSAILLLMVAGLALAAPARLHAEAPMDARRYATPEAMGMVAPAEVGRAGDRMAVPAPRPGRDDVLAALRAEGLTLPEGAAFGLDPHDGVLWMYAPDAFHQRLADTWPISPHWLPQVRVEVEVVEVTDGEALEAWTERPVRPADLEAVPEARRRVVARSALLVRSGEKAEATNRVEVPFGWMGADALGPDLHADQLEVGFKVDVTATLGRDPVRTRFGPLLGYPRVERDRLFTTVTLSVPGVTVLPLGVRPGEGDPPGPEARFLVVRADLVDRGHDGGHEDDHAASPEEGPREEEDLPRADDARVGDFIGRVFGPARLKALTVAWEAEAGIPPPAPDAHWIARFRRFLEAFRAPLPAEARLGWSASGASVWIYGPRSYVRRIGPLIHIDDLEPLNVEALIQVVEIGKESARRLPTGRIRAEDLEAIPAADRRELGRLDMASAGHLLANAYAFRGEEVHHVGYPGSMFPEVRQIGVSCMASFSAGPAGVNPADPRFSAILFFDASNELGWTNIAHPQTGGVSTPVLRSTTLMATLDARAGETVVIPLPSRLEALSGIEGVSDAEDRGPRFLLLTMRIRNPDLDEVDDPLRFVRPWLR